MHVARARPILATANAAAMLQELSAGHYKDVIKRRDQLEYDAPAEIDQQIQVAISGQAGNGASYVPLTVMFDVYFNSGSASRASNLRWPHFTYGYQIDPPNNLQVWCHVTEWIMDVDFNTNLGGQFSGLGWASPNPTNNTIIGAKLVWGSSAPDQQTGTLINFTGSLHLNFQGLAAPFEVDAIDVAQTGGGGTGTGGGGSGGGTPGGTPPPGGTGVPPPPPPPPGTMGLVPASGIQVGSLLLDEEFDGTSLNRDIWTDTWYTGLNYGGVPISPGNVSISGSVATLGVVNGVGALLASDPSSGPNIGFQFGYCYAEARLFLPVDAGGRIINWNSFWTSSHGWPKDGEEDIVETIAGAPMTNYHWGDNTNPYNFTIPGAWGGKWVDFAMHRLPGRYDIYWDQTLVKSYPNNDGGALQYLVLSAWQGYWTSAHTNAAILCDSIRVWNP